MFGERKKSFSFFVFFFVFCFFYDISCLWNRLFLWNRMLRARFQNCCSAYLPSMTRLTPLFFLCLLMLERAEVLLPRSLMLMLMMDIVVLSLKLGLGVRILFLIRVECISISWQKGEFRQSHQKIVLLCVW